MAPLQSEDQQQEHQHHHQREHHHHLHTRSHPHSYPHSAHHSHHHHHLVAPSSPRTLSPATEQPHHHHHHHQRQHHHHHHHHSHTTTTTTSPAPSSSPQLHHSSGRTESPAFGMNKSSNTAAAGSAAPASPSYSSSTGPAQQQQQVISRTGRGGPAPSSLANPGGSAPAAAPPAGRSAINGTNGQQHHPSTSSAHTNGKAASSPHHLHSHHPSASSSSSVRPPGAPTGVAGFGGPITVAEALSNVNTDRALGPLPPHSSSSAGPPPPWSSSATANTAPPLSAGHHMHSHPSTAAVVPGPSSTINATIHASAAANTSLTGLASGPNMPGGVKGATVASTANTPNDPHNLPIRWVTEHGNYLNHEAARELGGKEGFNILERKKNLPQLLQKLESETESCYSEIGSIAWNLGDYAKAKKHFEIALKRNPFCLASLNGLARYYHEIAANGGGAGSSNISTSTDRGGGGGGISGMSNNNINGSSTNGITSNNGAAGGGGGANTSITSIEESYNKVVDYASRSLSIDETGNEGEIWSLIGHSFLQLGQMSRAYSCYQQAIAKAIKKDDPKLWYGIGILYDRYGSVEHAEEAFASVLKLDPNFHKREEVFFRLGIIYKLQGKADASLECFHYILARPPEPLKAVDVWYQIGHAHELKRDLTLAKDAYERVLSTTPDHSKVLQHLGGIYLRESTPSHNPQKCIDYISQSLEHDSTDPFSWYLLGRAFMQQSNYGKAYEAYQQAVYRDGKNPAYWCSIGVLYFNINQFHDALDAYTRAVRIHPFIPEIWQNLGILYESCHDQLADATDAYQRASQLDPGNVELERRLKEVRNALRNGTEITSAPPPPQDIMPDSKSWHSVHMDVSGAKPVYLDSKSISQQASPAPEPPLGLGPGGVGPASVMPMHAREGALLRGSPPLANGGPPPGYGGAGAGGGMGVHELQTNGRRRSSFSRPDSSHGVHGHGAPPPPGAYPVQYPEEAMRGRHGPAGAPTGHPLSSQHALTMAGRPSAHSLAGPAHEPDPRDGPISHRGGPAGSRIPPPSSTLGRGPPPPTFPGDRHSPHSMHDPTFRHTAISPTNSPRTRAAEYEYQLRAAAAAERHGDPLYERERQLREAEREREEQSRAGSRAGLPPQHPQQREQQQHREQQQRRHPGPSAGPGGPSHSPTDQRTPSAFSQRDYPAPGSRRPGSPLQGGPPPPAGSRYAEERGAPGPGRTASSRPMPPGYPYGYYQDGPHAYADPRRDPRYNNDPRYEYEAAERERQVRRGGHPPSALEEEERRRRSEMDKHAPSPAGIRTGRRDHSPVDMLDGRERELRRGIPPPGQGDHGPGLPSMRLVAPRGQGGHYGSQPEQGQRSAGGPPPDQKGTAMDRRRQHGRHPDMPPETHLSNRQPEQTFDDETDMANALIGLAGIASNADVASSMGGGGPSSSYRAGEKRPGSPSHDEEARFKKARGQDDMSL